MSFNPIVEALDEMGKEMLVIDKEKVIINIAKILVKLFRPDLDSYDNLHPISKGYWKDYAKHVYEEVKKSK